MKKLSAFLFITLMIGCKQQNENGMVVKGTVKNRPAKTVFLEENPGNSAPVIVDSAAINANGSFTLKTQGKNNSLYSLRLDHAPFPFAILINDSKEITVDADFAKKNEPYHIKGSTASQELQDYDLNLDLRAQKIFVYNRQVDSLSKLKTPDSLVRIPFMQYTNATGELKQFATDAMNKATNPILFVYEIGGYQRIANELGMKGLSTTELNTLVNNNSTRFPNNPMINELKTQLKPKQAPDFTLPDVNGKQVSLSSFRGKYVLVDFWASWCGPCRAENPNVVKAYHQFSNKNFTILGVSLDQTKDAWLKAIKDDGLEWTQVSDLKYWNSAAATLYNVESIPYNILLDPSGRIIGESLRGEELVSKLNEVLK